MSDDKPKIIDLRKSQTEKTETENEQAEEHNEGSGPGGTYDEAQDEYPDNMEEGSPEDTGSGNVYDEARDEYPEDAEGKETSKGEDEKAFSLRDFNLTSKFAEEKGFGDLKEGSVVLIDTPLEGAKVGEVTNKEESWTGTLQVKVDTGANQYDISPYEDEFSERFIACLDGEGEVSQNLLSRLGKTSIDKVEVGNQVILDTPHIGPVRGTVAYKTNTETQGIKVDVNAGPATFTMYEDPSPAQKKEQPILVGQIQG